eukprot:GILK01013731.1.p1 GENE.GILK01013731.1~~GILK01013731.1.p1  ORF type:complete len:712 (+),score=57.07 GILK01013731.1:36-2138(+)
MADVGMDVCGQRVQEAVKLSTSPHAPLVLRLLQSSFKLNIDGCVELQIRVHSQSFSKSQQTYDPCLVTAELLTSIQEVLLQILGAPEFVKGLSVSCTHDSEIVGAQTLPSSLTVTVLLTDAALLGGETIEMIKAAIRHACAPLGCSLIRFVRNGISESPKSILRKRHTVPRRTSTSTSAFEQSAQLFAKQSNARSASTSPASTNAPRIRVNARTSKRSHRMLLHALDENRQPLNIPSASPSRPDSSQEAALPSLLEDPSSAITLPMTPSVAMASCDDLKLADSPSSSVTTAPTCSATTPTSFDSPPRKRVRFSSELCCSLDKDSESEKELLHKSKKSDDLPSEEVVLERRKICFAGEAACEAVSTSLSPPPPETIDASEPSRRRALVIDNSHFSIFPAETTDRCLQVSSEVVDNSTDPEPTIAWSQSCQTEDLKRATDNSTQTELSDTDDVVSNSLSTTSDLSTAIDSALQPLRSLLSPSDTIEPIASCLQQICRYFSQTQMDVATVNRFSKRLAILCELEPEPLSFGSTFRPSTKRRRSQAPVNVVCKKVKPNEEEYVEDSAVIVLDLNDQGYDLTDDSPLVDPLDSQTRGLLPAHDLTVTRCARELTYNSVAGTEHINEYESPTDLVSLAAPASSFNTRARRRWTSQEIQYLRDGVAALGSGRWSEILGRYAFINRSPTDLQDQWRNLLKYDSIESLS